MLLIPNLNKIEKYFNRSERRSTLTLRYASKLQIFKIIFIFNILIYS